MQIKKLAVTAAAAGALALSVLTAGPASADYAPGTGDAVGVGSDTLQYLVDFVADGNHLGATGFNALGNVNRLINFDATADANARLAYGVVGSTQGSCSPGTGTKTGTGLASVFHVDTVCQLNPTIVLRAGLRPVQRPNGSGAGVGALNNDIVGALKNIDFARSSAKKGSSFTTPSSTSRITVGTENFVMLTAATTHAVALSAADIYKIYSATTGGTNGFGGTGCVTWNEIAGNSGGSANVIVPLYPQTASGTFSFFASATTGVGQVTALVPGNCATAVEENDPEAIAQVTSKADAIEPISGARMNLFLGLKGDGTNNAGSSAYPYFVDPSCTYGSNAVGSAGGTGYGTTNVSCGVGAVSSINFPQPAAWAPAVTQQTGAGWWKTTRDVYIYFRNAEISNHADQFEPGINQNLIRTLFANPCSGTSFGNVALLGVAGSQGCTTDGTNTFGPGGAPYFDTAAASALISSSGFTPAYSFLNTVTSAD